MAKDEARNIGGYIGLDYNSAFGDFSPKVVRVEKAEESTEKLDPKDFSAQELAASSISAIPVTLDQTELESASTPIVPPVAPLVPPLSA